MIPPDFVVTLCDYREKAILAKVQEIRQQIRAGLETY